MTFLTRTLQFLLVLTLGAGSGLWFAARRGDRGMIDEEVMIARPAPVVYRWIASEDLARRWISNLVELRKLASGRSPQDANSLNLVELIAGHRVEMTLRPTRVVPGQEVAWQVSSGDSVTGGFSGDATFKVISSSGDFTRLTFTSHTRFVNSADRMLEPVLTFAAHRKVKNDLAQLKLLLEAEPANSPNLRAMTR